MLCSPVHRGYRIDDIERLFFRPMQLGQARVWRRKGPDGEPAMVGVLTWAWLSPEVEERYQNEGSLKEMSDWTRALSCRTQSDMKRKTRVGLRISTLHLIGVGCNCSTGKGSDTGQLWFIDLIAPFGDFKSIAKEIPALFPNDQTVKRLRVRNKLRRPTVRRLRKPKPADPKGPTPPFITQRF